MPILATSTDKLRWKEICFREDFSRNITRTHKKIDLIIEDV